jgi:TRAP-type C4-dicarboxylate transport system permease small subunit
MPGNTTATACLVLGVVMMYLAMMYITRQVEKDSTAKGLRGFVGILLGGTVLSFAITELGAGTEELAWYAIGLGVGLVVYIVLHALNQIWKRLTGETGDLFPLLRRFRRTS